MPLGTGPMPGLHSNPKTATQKRYDQQRNNPQPLPDGSFGRDPYTGARMGRQQAIDAMRPGSPLQNSLEADARELKNLEIQAYRKKLMSQQ